jgi:hypothetical protein
MNRACLSEITNSHELSEYASSIRPVKNNFVQMKKLILFSIVISLLSGTTGNSQIGGLLKKVSKSMTNELLGKPEEVDRGPEPKCACDKPELAMDMGGKLQLDYSELSISISDDGSILAEHRYLKEYYIVQNGVTTGPIRPGDKRLNAFNIENGNSENNKNPWADNKYISMSGDKFLITFGGKTYGPFGSINSFIITGSKDKFAATVVENVVVNEDMGKKMDEAMKNAKTDQEKMDIAMKYSADMQQKMMAGGGPTSIMPKVVTNIPGSTFDPLQGGTMNSKMKFDDILVNKSDKITDMQGKTILTLSPEVTLAGQLFISSDNSRYARYDYGTLTFSDKTTMSELFNPRLIKESGQVYLAYMYYSPKKNAIVQCRIPF